MKLYHYTTFSGAAILKSNVLLPSYFYSATSKHNTTTPWPALVFLTSDPNWEPSVQAIGDSGVYHREASDPSTYTLEGIPCWRITVDLPKDGMKLMYPHPRWLGMLRDGKSLGADIKKWHWTEKAIPVTECHKWIKGGWRLM